MAAPIFNEIYSVEESLQMMTSARLFKNVAAFVSATEVTLKAPTSIVNAGETSDSIAFSCDGGLTYAVEFFVAGQEKMRRVTHVGGTGEGTGGDITSVNIWES